MHAKRVRRALVICPLSIMKSAWLGDIMKTVIHRSAAVAHHTQAERRIEIIRGDYEFVIINYDALGIVADAILKDGRFDLIICDEANAVKNTQTRRWKALAKIAHPDAYLWLMTGTPAAQSPLDAFGLARLVNPSAVPKYATAWRDMVMNKVTMFKWVPKANAAERVHAALQPAIRFTKAECLDLPPVLTETREVPLTAQQTKYYKALKEQLVTQAAGETITAINAASAVNKLLQISAGAAYSDDGEVVVFDCSPRMNVLLEVLDQTERSVIVFAHYRHSIDTIMDALKKNGIGAAAIHGDVRPNERTEQFKKFQSDPSLKVLVIQPQAAAHGVTLTAADTVVFWSPIMSVENYVQCTARADRIGQTSEKVTVIHLQGSEIERRMYKVLEQRLSEHTATIDLYKEELTSK
jgi:SNF2 family DNA or RNA helicase